MERVRQMQRIKELRKEKSMNQIALGMELNFSQKIISEYENGKVEPSITTLKKLASIFNTSVDYIIEYTNIRQPIDKIAQSKLSETECDTSPTKLKINIILSHSDDRVTVGIHCVLTDAYNFNKRGVQK